MARTNATNFTGGLQFPYATAATDVFHKEDIQVLAQAVDQHDHTAGKGVVVPISTNASLLTNGSFDVWQRGSGPFTAIAAYSADRWIQIPAGTDAFSITKDTANIDAGSLACAAVVFTLGTGAGGSAVVQALKQNDGYANAGKTVSASARVRTATASAVRVGVATDGTGGVTTYSAFHPGGGTYQTLSVTVNVPSNATYVQLGFYFAASCTAYLDNTMLVVGPQPAAYMPLHPADDLAKCLRYYELLGDGNVNVVIGGWNAAAAAAYTTLFTAKKAVTPTVTKNGTWTANNCGQPSLAGNFTNGSCAFGVTATATGYADAFPTTTGQNISFEANA